MKKTYIASCSFGKDSIAMLKIIHDNNLPLDEVIFVEPMFDENTSGLYPKQKAFVEYASNKIKQLWGYNVNILRSDVTYKEQFYIKKKRGKHIGDINGFPCVLGAWCNGSLKMRPIKKFEKQFKNVHHYVGIAYDEKKRHDKLLTRNNNSSSPLFDYKITENMAMNICKDLELLSPIYKEKTRDGCWFCHNQRVSQLRTLRKEYPKYWDTISKLQLDCKFPFTPNKSWFDLERRFANEDKELKLDL